VDGWQVVGVLRRTELLAALADFGQDCSVSQVMRRGFSVAAPDETLNELFHRVHNCDCHTTPVVRDGKLVGLITMEHLGEYLLIESHSHKTNSVEHSEILRSE
jgi:predicted transcriptional regulator